MEQTEITELVQALSGERASHVVIKNCSLVSVYTGEIIPDTDIAIYKSYVSYVGPDAAQMTGKDTRIIDAKNRYVAPGLADPHTHIDQFILPHHVARHAISHGTTTLFSDPVDITSVCGYDGLVWFADACSMVQARVFNCIPGGVPVDPKLSSAKSMTQEQIRNLMDRDDIFGMGEVFAWTKVIKQDIDTIQNMATIQEMGGIINGHTAGMSGTKLAIYAASGITSCHEPINYDQTIERLRMGMYVMVREGSIRRDLYGILKEISSRRIDTSRLMLCTDGLNPTDMQAGHMDHCVREAIRAGVDPVQAISMASLNVFRYYRMDHMLGGISVGRLADIILLNDMDSFDIGATIIGGQISTNHNQTNKAPQWLYETVGMDMLSDTDLAVPAQGDEVAVNTILLQTEIITKLGRATLPIQDGKVCATDTVWKVAAIKRDGTQKALGFLENFGTKHGGMATTATFHDNDIIAIGNSDADMATAINQVIKSRGATTAVIHGEIRAHMPLPIAGIISEMEMDDVSEQFVRVQQSFKELGCTHREPHLIPLFLPFLALPSIRIQSNGLINVKDGAIIPTIIPLSEAHV
ncbi:MAG: adenine deaminase [Cenarchaeum sp. SB0662_bin_33]|nr:adenine deaminase [Cenarchaeum sp. SB0662_bin_33]